jgi:hypothetical protein
VLTGGELGALVIIDAVARMSRLDRAALPVNFGDLVTAYAQKPAQ